MTVAIRVGLRGRRSRGRRARSRRCCPRSGSRSRRRPCATTCTGAWRFLLAGLLAPGVSQLLFTSAVREVGASRTSVAAGVAPLVRPRDRLRLPRRARRAAARPRRLRDRRRRRGARSRARPSGPSARCAASSSPSARRPCSRSGTTSCGRCMPHGSPETAAAATLLGRDRRRLRLHAARADAGRAATTRSGRDPVRALLPLPLRGVLPRAGLGRLAARRDRVALGRRALGARLPGRRGGGPTAARSARCSSSSAGC